ncbi:MAG: hypothetical protein KGJ78_09660 [Alphaproteobacteria bacterium]|nr:hypothetical protein [Alphaproteobacteria bacterium]
MKLGDLKFFNLFALLALRTNPDRTADRWKVGAVSWTRRRLTERGPDFSVQIEVHTVEQDGRRGWVLLVGHETWWDGKRKDAFRNGRWAHVTKGARADVLKWFAAQENLLQ